MDGVCSLVSDTFLKVGVATGRTGVVWFDSDLFSSVRLGSDLVSPIDPPVEFGRVRFGSDLGGSDLGSSDLGGSVLDRLYE